ncbi:hypothetical protein H2198_003277 [Neophaeococcomyces mojaviensis]|uniref:Uncharacterized protein n=1 Tax=Neophaeococcomyces mojaviensis TaxID=3383035 RepID=A0ACC3ACB5_9EURO|nr:hypothetical protein H2198_003277 [Knufia sp. JES_112]
MAESLPLPKRTRREASPEETAVDHDDLCHICHMLLHRPVLTTCRHTFCEPCMAHWADVSITTQMTTLGLDVDEPLLLPPNEIETKCPMCRTLTVAKLDADREAALRSKYTSSYDSRQKEYEEAARDETGAFVEPLTLFLGNEHRLIRTDELGSKNNHEWVFFVRPSRTDIIEEVQIFLHPTFRNPKIVVQHPPYHIRRVGWGVFSIDANVILKAGYSWVSSEAEDTADGGIKGKLPLEWMLDFRGRGSQGRLRLKVRKEKDNQEEEDQRQGERSHRLWLQQRQRDPDYIPPPSPPPDTSNRR